MGSSITAIALDCINVQVDAAGNLVGYIHKDRMLEFLQNAKLNRDGCIKFSSEKRKVAHKLYSHMPPLYIQWGAAESSSLPIPEHDLSSTQSHPPLNGHNYRQNPEDERF